MKKRHNQLQLKESAGSPVKALQRYHDPGVILIIVFSLVMYFCLFLILLLPEDVQAAFNPEPERISDPRNSNEGRLYLQAMDEDGYLAAPMQETVVDVQVTGFVAKATVEQRFTNNQKQWLEGVYVFPLPEDAAVTSMRMRIGERLIEGVVKERLQARKTYEKAKETGKKASLLEQHRPNIFSMNIANIGPGEEISVELVYLQTVAYSSGSFTLRVPTVVGPRYIPGKPFGAQTETRLISSTGWALDTDRVTDASQITPEVNVPGEDLVNPVTMTVHLDTVLPLQRIQSLSHDVDVEHLGEGKALVRLNNAFPANQDFVLIWEPLRGHAPRAAFFSEEDGIESYSLLMLLPPLDEYAATIALPREVIFVLDISGSMDGESIRQMRSAVSLAQERLTTADTFNIITFNDRANSLFVAAKRAEPARIKTAMNYVAGLEARGGTEMASALQLALDGKEKAQRMRQVIFLTDGCVGNEPELFRLIAERLGKSRLFTVGIGSAPNSHFMRGSARKGRGTFTYVARADEIQPRMEALFQKLETPALTDIMLSLGQDFGVESYPDPIPDLFFGEPVVLAIKAAELPEEVTLYGHYDGQPWQTTVHTAISAEQRGLSKLWAREKIAAHMDAYNTAANPAEKEQIKASIIDTALTHQLASKFTSMVAVDRKRTRPNSDNLHAMGMRANLPKGWRYQSVFGVPRTATGSDLLILVGMLCMMLASVMKVISQREAGR